MYFTITSPQNCALPNISFCVRKELKYFSNLTWFKTALNPIKWWVIPEKFNYLFPGTFWGNGFSPSTVFLCEAPNLKNSFLAAPTIPWHFSLTSLTLSKRTPNEFIFAEISSHTFLLFLFVNVEVNLLLIISMFFSASLKITAHSAAVQFGFRFLLFSAIVFNFARGSRTHVITIATAKVVVYPPDSYAQHYPSFM